ncbi:MAG: REP element-mobilizing transposase RayT [Flavobacteriales bacterium]|jgi:REP element-mobilizing transposase RayT
MSEKYKVVDSSKPTFITLTLVGWVDVLIRRKYINLLDESLAYCIQNKGLKVHAYVYMTSHIHLIVTSDKDEIQDIVRDFKKHTSKKLIELIGESGESRKEWMLNKFAFEAKRVNRASNYKVWKDGFHPVILDDNKKLMQRLNYIHYNPVDAGFVDHERDWLNSSYRGYEEGYNLKLYNFELFPLY